MRDVVLEHTRKRSEGNTILPRSSQWGAADSWLIQICYARLWWTPEEYVMSGKAYRVILDVAEQEAAEIIVIGVHGKGVLNRRLFGSTTHHVIREARCPMLTLRAWSLVTIEQKPPDVMVLGAEWPQRALLRAQLIEEGHEVVAVDSWPIPRLYLQPGMKPRVLLIDLHELPTPRETLDQVRFMFPPTRVLVLIALGSLTGKEVRALGFNVIERPVTIGQIVAAIEALLSRTASERGPQAASSLRKE
jgi:hypothetical protein